MPSSRRGRVALAAMVAILAIALFASSTSPPALQLVRQRAAPADDVFVSGLLPLTAVALATPTTAETNQPVTFTCTGAGGNPPYSYSWAFGDGSTGSGSPAVHAYGTTGAMTAECTVTDATFATAMGVAAVLVIMGISVVANVDHPNVAPGTPVHFSAQASGGTGIYTSYAWTFDDGTTGSGAQVSHTYVGAGSFHPSVTVTDSNGGTGSASVSVNVAPIQVKGYESTSTALVGATINFTAVAGGGAGAPFSYNWDFGDGVTGSGDNVAHAYVAPGNYTPSVVATDSLGATGTADLAVISIYNSTWSPGGPINVTILASPTFPLVNESVSLVAIGHGGAGSPNCTWDFGDAHVGTGCSVSHVWAASGDYAVRVNVSDSGGNHDTASLQIHVDPTLRATFSWVPEQPKVGQAVNLTAVPAGGSGLYSCLWNFGDTVEAVGCTASHAWTADRSYAITLTIVDSRGHRISTAELVTVVPAFSYYGGGGLSAEAIGALLGVPILAGLFIAAMVVYARRKGRAPPSEAQPRTLDDYLEELERFTNGQSTTVNRKRPPGESDDRKDGRQDLTAPLRPDAAPGVERLGQKVVRLWTNRLPRLPAVEKPKGQPPPEDRRR